MPIVKVSRVSSQRVFPKHRPLPANGGQIPATPLSLLDCTTANFLPTSAVWFFARPDAADNGFALFSHLRDTLSAALDACPCWAGRLSAISAVDGNADDATYHLPPHARRFGRIHVHYGDESDAGVEFVAAKSCMTLNEVYDPSRPTNTPCWDRSLLDTASLNPGVEIADALAPHDASRADSKPLVAIQVTEFACGGYALVFKIAHCLADISSVTMFMRHWADVSRAVLENAAMPQSNLVFDPQVLDGQAAGDINAEEPVQAILDRARTLPFHRYDWWLPSSEAGRALEPPAAFQHRHVRPTGKVMPWKDWDRSRPVSHYVLHFTPEHLEAISAKVRAADGLSVHDAVLAHIWSCVARANNLSADDGLAHCDFSTGVRANFGLPKTFLGSPMVIVNAALPGRVVANTDEVHTTARAIRVALTRVRAEGALAAHLHDVAYEDSPQRLWQAFLGRRHMLVTSWTRAGLYDVDFGVGNIAYVDSVLEDLDGIVLIKEAPPVAGATFADWAANGVDVSLHLASDVVTTLLADPLLFPA